MTDSADARLAALERRVALLEDHLAITQVLLAYGPSVDSGCAAGAAQLWAAQGSYEYQADVPALVGRDAVAAMVGSRGHHAHLDRGCAHVITAPHIWLDGDRAVATCYSLMHHFDPQSGGFRVSRVSANRWELARTPAPETAAAWQVVRRTNRLLDGDPAARELLLLSGQRGGNALTPP